MQTTQPVKQWKHIHDYTVVNNVHGHYETAGDNDSPYDWVDVRPSHTYDCLSHPSVPASGREHMQ